VLLYSWNQGSSWEECVFSSDNVRVLDIMNEPLNTGKSFILHGVSTPASGQVQGVLIKLDFSNLLQRNCTQPQDYEQVLKQSPTKFR
jgi:hypothetical protein